MKYLKRFVLIFLAILLLVIGTIFVTITFYKKEMMAMLMESLKASYGLTLNAEEVNVSFFSNWPNASIQLKNIHLTNDLCKEEVLLMAGSVSLSFNIQKLLKKEFIVKSIAINDADICLVRNDQGIKNFEIRKTDTVVTTSSDIHFELGMVSIKNTRFSFLNKQHHKSIEFTLIDNELKLIHYADGVDVNFSGPVFIKGLLFRQEKGPFLSNTLATLNLNARMAFKRKEILIHKPSFVVINNQRFDVSSFIDLNENKRLVLSVDANQINYDLGISLLNKGIKKGLSNIHIKKPIDVKVFVIAKIGEQEEPIIVIKAHSVKNDLTIGNSKIPYSDIDFEANIISLDSSMQKGNSDNAKVVLKSIRGKVYGLPFNGSLVIHNFNNPFIKINADLFIDVKQIPFKPGKVFVLNGTANAILSYSGPVNKLNHEEFLDAPMNLNAKLKFNNVSYREKNKPYTYLVNGNALVTNKELKFDNLLLKMDGGSFTLKGSVDNFVKYTLGLTNGFKAKLNASTDCFDLTGYLVKKKTNFVPKHTTEEKLREADEETNFEFDVSLSAKKLVIRKVEADQALIVMHYKTKLLTLKSLNINTCSGKLSASGTIYDLHKIDATIATQNINVNTLFDQFENFGQKAIESKNLDGNIFLNAKIKMDLDDKMEVIGKTMKGVVKLKLKNGHLRDYEPMQKISDYIFKNRNFQDISFSELNETFLVDGFKMQIQEMEIASNVLNLYMSGVYHFKEQSNINILLPWSNLKRRGKNYLPKNSGQTADNSNGLKLNYSGYPNNLKLNLGNKK